MDGMTAPPSVSVAPEGTTGGSCGQTVNATDAALDEVRAMSTIASASFFETERAAVAPDERLRLAADWRQLSVTAIAAENASVFEYVRQLEHDVAEWRLAAARVSLAIAGTDVSNPITFQVAQSKAATALLDERDALVSDLERAMSEGTFHRLQALENARKADALRSSLQAETARLDRLSGWLYKRACLNGNTPERYGVALRECAGGLAYFTLGERSLGPAKTFEEALESAIAAASPETTTP